MLEWMLLILIGALASTLGSLVGIGGGFIYVPFLMLYFNLPPQTVVGTSLLTVMFNSLSGTVGYLRQKRVDLSSGLMFALASLPGSLLGAYIVENVVGDYFRISFGIFMLTMALTILTRPDKPIDLGLPQTAVKNITDSSGQLYTYAYNRNLALLISFATGFLSSVFGIGGGIIMVPTMVLLLNFPTHVATATSMLMILISVFVGSISHLALNNILWDKALLMAAGAIIGGQFGTKLAPKIKGPILMKILTLVLIFLAFKLIFK